MLFITFVVDEDKLLEKPIMPFDQFEQRMKRFGNAIFHESLIMATVNRHEMSAESQVPKIQQTPESLPYIDDLPF